MEKIELKSFEEAYKAWKEGEAMSFEPSTMECECGAKRFMGESEMIQGERYCDGIYQYILTDRANARMKTDGKWETRAMTLNQPQLFYAGNCPVPVHDRIVTEVRKIKGEYLTLAGEPMEFNTFDKSVFPEAFERAFEFGSTGQFRGKKKLWISGPTGTGKTHLARSIYLQLMLEMRECMWISAVKLAECFRQAGAQNDDFLSRHQAIDWLDRAGATDYLFIDDLGAERIPRDSGEFFKEQLKELLDHLKGGLVVTTNLPSGEQPEKPGLKQRYEDKIYDRLMVNSEVILLAGVDYRRRNFPKR